MFVPGASRSRGGPEFEPFQTTSPVSKLAPTPNPLDTHAGAEMPVVTEPLPEAATGAISTLRSVSKASLYALFAASQLESLLHVALVPKLMFTAAMFQSAARVSAT